MCLKTQFKIGSLLSCASVLNDLTNNQNISLKTVWYKDKTEEEWKSRPVLKVTLEKQKKVWLLGSKI